MRIAVYGGSFNPPHVGHAMVAAWLRWTDRVDEVWLLPAYAHPFDKELAPFERRVSMCRALAVSVGPWVRVEPIERDLPVPSYTVDTLEVLAARHREKNLRLVVGSDVLSSTSQWKDWDRILRLF
jgi:nicotinate-nucleotide adenylyltransferase